MICPLCDKKNLSELVLTESRHSRLIFNRLPATNGHFLVIPKKHVTGLTELLEVEWFDLFFLLKTSMEKLEKAIKHTGLNGLFNQGVQAGQTMEHFHFHLIYRQKDDGFENAKRTPSCRSTPARPEEIEKMRSFFKQ